MSGIILPDCQLVKREKKSLDIDRNIRLLYLPLMSCGQHKIGAITFTETLIWCIYISKGKLEVELIYIYVQ